MQRCYRAVRTRGSESSQGLAMRNGVPPTREYVVHLSLKFGSSSLLPEVRLSTLQKLRYNIFQHLQG